MPVKIEETEELLQAVIISDSYNSRFKPLTQDIPRCLLPLANTPLIEYTLEFLASSGVKQVFIFVCVHADKIKDYIQRSKWSLPSAPFKVEFIPTPDSMSAGDAMRELDVRQLIKSDFILLSGDVVSNLAADEIVEEHRKRRVTNKDSIMTMVVREANPSHRSRPSLDNAVFALDSATSQCISYTPIKVSPRTKQVALDLKILLKHDTVKVRNDLIDCNIDICSPDVPALFTENFDYQDIRKDFMHGILTDDLLGKQIHCHVAKDTYASRVASLQTYDAVSKDIVSRWTYPLVPDNNLLKDQSYTYQRSHIYKEQDVRLARSAVISAQVVIGSGTRTGDGAVIARSIIGRDCVIGNDCMIDGAYLWQNVSVGSGSNIKQAVLADNVVIGRNCTIGKGAILGPRVRIADDTTIPEYAKLSASEDERTDESLVGQGGYGALYQDSDDEDEDDASNAQDKHIDVSGLIYTLNKLNFSDSSISSIASSESGFVQHIRSNSVATSNFSDDDKHVNFYALAKADLEAAIAEGHSVNDTMLEMTSLRMQKNVEMHEVRIAMLAALLNEIQRQLDLSGKIESIVQGIVKQWGPLLMRTISSDTMSEDCQDLILSLQVECAKEMDRQKMFVPMLNLMYHADILPEEQILEWFESPKSQDKGPVATQVRQKAKIFVTWLQEAEEDSEDESDSE